MALVRFGVSLEEELLKDLDKYVIKNKFPNRSQAIKQIVVDVLVKEKYRDNELVAGAVTIVYLHQKNNLLQSIRQIQSDYLSIVLSSMNFHVDHNHSMEIIAVKGFAYIIQDFSEKLIALKGVEHGSLSITK